MFQRIRLGLAVGGLFVSAALSSAVAQAPKTGGGGTGRQEPGTGRGEGGPPASGREAGQGQGPGAGRQGPGGGNPFGMMNDPAERLRRLRNEISTRPRNNNNGGPGGMMMMCGGMSTGIWGLLMRNQALQEEIKFTAEQKQKLETINTNSREKMRDVARQAFQNRGQGGGNDAGGGRGGRGQFNMDPRQMEEMQSAMAAMRQENEAAVRKIVTKDQIKRLNEIRLRILGPFGVAEEDVARELPLNESQYADVLAIMADYDQRSSEIMQEQFRGMRDRFRGAGGPGGGRGRGGDAAGGAPGATGGQAAGTTGQPGGPANRGQATRGGDAGDNAPAQPGNRSRGRAGDETAKSDDTAAPAGDQQRNVDKDDEEDVAQNGRRGFQMTDEQRAEMEKNISEARKKTEDLDKQAEAALRKVLTLALRTRYNKMLGADFDLNKLVEVPEGFQRGRDGGRPGDPNAPRAPGAPAGGNNAAPEKGAADDDAAPAQPRSRPAPRVRGG